MSYFNVDKQQKEVKAANAIQTEGFTQRDSYYSGEYDGKIGREADKELIKFLPYRKGYQVGISQYYLDKYNIKLETEF